MNTQAPVPSDETPRPDLLELLGEVSVPPLSEVVRRKAAEVAKALPGTLCRVGGRVGPYRVQALLGRGGQASVFRVEDEAGRPFALKTPNGSLVTRLVREAQILFHLDHPNVLRVEAVNLDGPLPYILTEYMPVGTLAERLAQRGSLRPSEVHTIAGQILEALDYAHRKGVVHRDLKPSNVLFAQDGSVKVADFGIGTLGLLDGREVAQTLVSSERTLFAGTPLYMAPEQEQPGAVDGRADLYALGKLVYEALTGRSPRTIKPVSRLVDGLGPAWDAFVFRLLEDDPADRFATAKDAQRALSDLFGAPAQAASRALPGTGPDGPGVRSGGQVAVLGTQDGRRRPRRRIVRQADVAHMNEILDEHLRLSSARCSLVVDVEGRPLTARGPLDGLDLETVAALVAASFAATGEVAKLLGERTFHTLAHEGDHEAVQLTRVGERTLLVTVFDVQAATVAGVGFHAKDAASELAALLGPSGRSGADTQRVRHVSNTLARYLAQAKPPPQEQLDTIVRVTLGKLVDPLGAELLGVYLVGVDDRAQLAQLFYSRSLFRDHPGLETRFDAGLKALGLRSIPAGSGLIGRCIRDKVSIATVDATRDPEFLNVVGEATGHPARTVLTVPIVDRTGPREAWVAFGAIQVINTSARHRDEFFSDDDLRVVEEIGAALGRLVHWIHEPELERAEGERAAADARGRRPKSQFSEALEEFFESFEEDEGERAVDDARGRRLESQFSEALEEFFESSEEDDLGGLEDVLDDMFGDV